MRRKTPPDRPDMPIAPMIDCVFLMLVYFMTTSSLDKSEAELPFPFAAAVPAPVRETAVDEQRIRLTGDARALWNGSAFRLSGTAANMDLQRLARQLQAFRGATELAGREAAVRLLPQAQCPHQALVRMLDALDQAGIERVNVP